jgi:fluoride exporter
MFLIGICFALVDKTDWLSPSTRLFLMTGFLGALTTFSTYAIETIVSLQSGTISVAVFNFLLNNMLGLTLVLSGIGLVQWVYQSGTIFWQVVNLRNQR